MEQVSLGCRDKRYVIPKNLIVGEVVVQDEVFLGVSTRGTVSHLSFPRTDIRMTGDLFYKKDLMEIGKRYTVTFKGRKQIKASGLFRYEYDITTEY